MEWNVGGGKQHNIISRVGEKAQIDIDYNSTAEKSVRARENWK